MLMMLQRHLLGLAVALAYTSSTTAIPPTQFNCSTQPSTAFEPVTLHNNHGMIVTMIAYGATTTHLYVPDANNDTRDVLLGWDDATQYCHSPQHTYFGATIGRVANRIANCSFDLGGQKYALSCNEKSYDTLHGGIVGFDRRVWTATFQNQSSVTWFYHSPDGEMGFPGALDIFVTHTLTDDNEWKIDYHAEMTNDETTSTSTSTAAAAATETVIALTNHAYFNLNANVGNTPTTMDHVLHFPTSRRIVQVTGAPAYHLIPTGKIDEIARDSAWDFYSAPKKIGQDINTGDVTSLGGYDNAWVFDAPLMTRTTLLQHVATLTSPLTGIRLDMFTDQPSVQMYTGNFLNGTDTSTRIPRKKSQTFGNATEYYQWRGAVTLEAQQFPDAVHHDNFPSIVLSKGETYVQSTVYQFSIAGGHGSTFR